eukprot:m.31467 g.31467  ORF g.31467 m.31467 type:complete len:824 (-) comp6934_c0_seq1:152-2623(-)
MVRFGAMLAVAAAMAPATLATLTHVSDQAGYTECRMECGIDTGCASWDYLPSTGECHLSPAEVEGAASVTGAPPPPPNPALQKLIEKYTAMKNETCAKVVPQAPTLDPTDAAAFMAAYGAYVGNNSEDAVYAAARKLITPAVDAFLSLPDSIASSTGLDAEMVLCAVLSDAITGGGGSPKGGAGSHTLANYAVLGPTQEATVDALLANYQLMRDMLVAGGPAGGNYGQAAEIYAAIQKSEAYRTLVGAAAPPPAPVPSLPECPEPASGTAWDDRDPSNALHRLALGVSVAHAIPIGHRYAADLPNNSKTVDPVARYTSFAHAYMNGDLDPAFPILTAFELAHAVDSDGTDEDQAWLRTTLANYAPGEVTMSYGWRFCESVHSDVQYGDSQCSKFPAGVCSGRYADIPCGGDVCGGRAFWGRFARKGFGLPTWGATEKGHASMSSWTPTGWIRQLGSAWPFCWWGARGGPDWYLETQARDNRCEFQKVLRAGWVGIARGDAPVSLRWTDDGAYDVDDHQGGLWPALAFYMKKITVQQSPAPNRTIPAALPPIVNKIDAAIARSKLPMPTANITTDADGNIIIPAAAFTSKNRSASVSIQRSFDSGTQVEHGGCSSPVGPPCFYPLSSAWTYNFSAATAGTYFLTANFTTYHYNQDLYVSVNGAKAVEVPVFYSVGWWNQSQPLSVAIQAGMNALTFTRTSTRQLVFKEFFLWAKAPVVPKPPGNYTPAPAPPGPPGGNYIEVPATTTCKAQGIQPVSEQDCGHACYALGFKSTGDRARPNISGCFVMTTGPYAGNCNYNTNSSATCTPPCTLYGAEVRSLCVRN